MFAHRTPSVRPIAVPAVKKSVPPPPPAKEKKILGKIAIVIDDWGYNLNNMPIANQIRLPFTASILPNLPYSEEVAARLHKKQVEIILHLPMEPHEEYGLEKNTLTTSLPDEQVRTILRSDLANIQFAQGVSNHMGSKATEDERLMSVVLKELKKRGLYFLDSLVSAHTVCAELAPTIGVRFAKRDIFLDNTQDPTYIWSQIHKLKKKAKMYGHAIGIGHDRKNTLKVLKEAMPQLEKEGYRFVYLSEVVE